jgi:hypothetical protein
MRSSNATSCSLGTLPRRKVSSVSKLAIISGKAAFLAPLMGMVPVRRWPPLILIRSMRNPVVLQTSRPCY